MMLSRHPAVVVAAAEDDGPIAFVRGKFDALDDKGKFIAGAAVGFVGARIVVGSAMKVVKIGAVAFIAYVEPFLLEMSLLFDLFIDKINIDETPPFSHTSLCMYTFSFFFRAEVLDKTGVIDYHDVIEDHYDTLTKVKDVCMSKIDDYRKTVEMTLNPQNIQSFMDKQRMASLGLGAGTCAGLLL